MLVAGLLLGSVTTTSAARASVARASTDDETRKAANALARLLPVPPRYRPAAKRCLAGALTRRTALVAAINRHPDVWSLSIPKQTKVLGILTRCLEVPIGERVLRLAAGPSASTDELSIAEIRCIGRRATDDDDAFSAIATEIGEQVGEVDVADFTRLEAQAMRIVSGCAQAWIGRRLAETAFPGASLSDAQHRCIGEGIAALGVEPRIAEALDSADDTPWIAASTAVAARCAPEAVTEAVTDQLTRSGAAPAAARCIADRLVRDPALLEAVALSAAAASPGDDGQPPPGLADVQRACGV